MTVMQTTVTVIDPIKSVLTVNSKSSTGESPSKSVVLNNGYLKHRLEM